MAEFLENMADGLKEDTLKEIGSTVVEDYKTDLASRSEWDARIERWYTLFSGLTDPKSTPWENASNVNIPLLSIACLQYQARAGEALLPAKEIAKCFSTDGKTIDVAKRCQNFMNWQLTEQMPEWEEDMDVLFLIQSIYGVCVKKTYYDGVLGRNVSRALRVDEFVAPYGVKRLEDASRKTHVYELRVNDIKIKGVNEIWINTDKIEGPGTSLTDKPADEHRDKTDRASGISESMEEKDKPRLILEQHRTWDLDGDGIEEPYIITVDKESELVLRIEPQSFDYFTAYNFIPNPDSWMGFGFGHLLEHLNHSTNSLINQLIDSGTLSNQIGGLIDRSSGINLDEIEFVMGEFQSVDVAGDDIRKAIYQFQFNPPSNVLFTLLDLLQGYARDLSSVSETMLGKLPPSDTTATTMLAVMEQGLKVFSTIYKRQHRTLKKELQKLAALNAVYLDEQVYFTVQDSTSSEMTTLESGKSDFSQTIDVIPVADPTITSRAEKLIKSRQAYELGMQNPDISQDPESRYALTRSLLEALEVQNIDAILKKPEPQEPPDLRPEEEEAEFINERGVQPLPEQDHEQHLLSHNIFKESDWMEQLTPQGKKLLEAHIRETMSLLYLQQRGLLNEAIETDFEGVIPSGIQGVAGAPLREGAFEGVGAEEIGFGGELTAEGQ
jgi:chaperonin GroES